MHVLVINLGLKSVRAIIFDERGRKLASASLPVQTVVSDVVVEQNPDEWWSKTVAVVRQAVGATPAAADITAVTVTASASCLTGIDRQGRATMNAIMVSDGRAQAEAERLETVESFGAVRSDTGMKASSDLTLPKIMWVQRHQPEVFAQTWKFLMPADFLIYRLTGEVLTDYHNAFKHHLSPTTLMLPDALLADLSIPPDRLPGSASTGTAVGTVLPDVAHETGLPAGAVVMLTTYDALCAVVGSGVASVGIASDVSGTVTSLRVLTDRAVNDPRQRIFCSRWLEPDGGLTLAGGSNNMGGGIIEWGKQLLLQDVAGDPYEVMVREAALVPPGANGLILLPYLLGERSPIWNPDARGVFFGLERGHTRHEMLRAILESTGYSVRHIYEVIQSLGLRIDELRFSGGLARLPLVAEMKADILGRPVSLVEEFETTALGAAMLVLRHRGGFATLADAASAMVRIARTCEPDQANHRIYTEFYEIYKDLYTSIRSVFRERSRVLASLHYKRITGERARKENL